MKNRIIDSERNGYGTDLADILSTIEAQTSIDSELLKTRFWDMFIVDALIGIWDRHNGNWGFLYNANTDEISLAPVFDCGSSLYPQADEIIMQAVLNDKNELNHRVFDMPLSAITYNGKKINYFKFISAAEFAECNEALKRITSRIDMEKIFEIIDSTPSITELQKDFYKVMLSERKEHILDFSRVCDYFCKINFSMIKYLVLFEQISKIQPLRKTRRDFLSNRISFFVFRR